MNRFQTRMKRLFETVNEIDHSLRDGQVSLESASDDIKNESWKIVSLYDDGIIKSKKFLDDYFSSNDLNDKPDLVSKGRLIQHVINKKSDFTEPNDAYRITPEEKSSLRQPLIYAYSQLFRDRPTFNAFKGTKDYTFEAILRPDLLASNLASGEPFKIIPNFLSGQKPLHRLRHILATLDSAKEAIRKQCDSYDKFFPIVLGALENNETIVDGDVSLQSNVMRINGAILNYNMTQAISATWGLHNPSANFDTMDSNLQMVIEDIRTEFVPSNGDEPAMRYQFLIKNLEKEKMNDIIVSIYRTIREINDIVPRVSTKLDEFQERLSGLNTATGESNQKIAIVLSRLLTLFSAAIFNIYTLCIDTIITIDAMFLSIERLGQRLVNYETALDTYIKNRSKR